MSTDAGTPTPMEQTSQATPEELCASTLQHYEEISSKACDWSNQVPQAIRFWYLERPKLQAELIALRAAHEAAQAMNVKLEALGKSRIAELRDDMQRASESWKQEQSAAQAEIAALREDAARLDWWQPFIDEAEQAFGTRCGVYVTEYGEVQIGEVKSWWSTNIRAAIDAARRKAK